VAREELSAVGEFDATVVNDDVQRAAEELLTLMGGTVRRTPPARPL
jgi:guanylate kinase